jgi:hypothetical protein
MVIDRRVFLRLSLASSAVACLHLPPMATFAAIHRPIVLLLGNVLARHSFVVGFSEALTANQWHAKLLTSPQHDLEIWTRDLRGLRGSRLVYLGDDRDQLLLQLALAGANARLLCSGHHGGSQGQASQHSLHPTTPAWSYGIGLRDDLTAAGHAFVIRDALIAGELRGLGRGSNEAPWPMVLGRRLATVASGVPLPAEFLTASVVGTGPPATFATLIADL